MQSRRRFLGTMSLPAAAAALGVPLRPTELRASAHDIASNLGRHVGTPAQIAADEDFWFEVAQAFTVDRSLVNLNNGGVSPAPALVQDAMKRHLDFSNLAPTYTMWQILEPQREGVRDRMPRRSPLRAMRRRVSRRCSSASTCTVGMRFSRPPRTTAG